MEKPKIDFEQFCATYGEISDKNTGKKISLKLNGAQRVVYEHLESCRKAGTPCRLLVLKSRQLGISTLLQYYFTWLLLFHCEVETFLSLCHNKQLSLSFINTMLSIFARYDKDLKPQRCADNAFEDRRGNHLLYGSAKNYNAVRGYNVGIAHLSESAFWHSKSSDWSEDVIRSVMGSVGNRAGTFVVMESTSDGKNNYFYKLWCDSVAGMTSYEPIFLSWQLCEYYRKPLSDVDAESLKHLTPSEQALVEQGCTLEQLNWYRSKRGEFQDESSFFREFPSTAEESFTTTSNQVFSSEELDAYAQMVQEARLIDLETDIKGRIIALPGSRYYQWLDVSSERMRYLVVVTIGNSVDSSKHNVITCWLVKDSQVSLCLERRYLCDVDELIDNSIMVARYYRNAILIVEVSSLDRMGLSVKDYYIRKMRRKYSRLFTEDGKVGYGLSKMRKMRGLFAFRRRLRDGLMHDPSPLMHSEMCDFVIENDELSASIDSHDDVILCRLILNDVLDEIGTLHEPLNPDDFVITKFRYIKN